MKKTMIASAIFLAIIAVSYACESKKGTAEKAGEKIDRKLEETKDKVNDDLHKAGDKIEEKLDKAGDKIDEKK